MFEFRKVVARSLTSLGRVYHRCSHTAPDEVNFRLAERLTSMIYPECKFSEMRRGWLQDRDFFAYYERVRELHEYDHYHCADRKYFLMNLLGLTHGLEGDTAECGVYRGASSFLICDFFRNDGKTHHAFDSFEGLSEPAAEDGAFWHKSDLASNEAIARKFLSEFDFVRFHKGWIPETFSSINGEFCFVHVDVDIFQPTLDSIVFFYPRLVTGGVLVCDDYGFTNCPGAKRAFDRFMLDKPERIVRVPTGQAFIVKR